MAQEIEGKVWVSSQYGKDGEEKTEERKLHVREFPDGVHPARVKVMYGLTLNLGNYESARCDAGVELPCLVEEIPEAYKEAWEIAKAEIQNQTKGVKKRG